MRPLDLHASTPARVPPLSATSPQAGRLDYSLPAKEALLKGELRCHRCGMAQPNMPRLKDHIASCRAPVQRPQN